MKNTYFKLSAVLLLAALLLGGARLGAQSLILTSDEQLNDLMDPDKKLDLSLGYTPYHASLRDICEQGKKQGSKQMVFAFDEFFRQYRQHAGTERRLTPDMDEYVEKIKFVSTTDTDLEAASITISIVTSCIGTTSLYLRIARYLP